MNVIIPKIPLNEPISKIQHELIYHVKIISNYRIKLFSSTNFISNIFLYILFTLVFPVMINYPKKITEYGKMCLTVIEKLSIIKY